MKPFTGRRTNTLHLIVPVIFRLPDDDREISVFDYFVDESGEWDTWASRYQYFPYFILPFENRCFRKVFTFARRIFSWILLSLFSKPETSNFLNVLFSMLSFAGCPKQILTRALILSDTFLLKLSRR